MQGSPISNSERAKNVAYRRLPSYAEARDEKRIKGLAACTLSTPPFHLYQLASQSIVALIGSPQLQRQYIWQLKKANDFLERGNRENAIYGLECFFRCCNDPALKRQVQRIRDLL